MTRTDFENWLDGYRQAWRTDDPDQIGALFTEEFAEWWVQRPDPA